MSLKKLSALMLVLLMGCAEGLDPEIAAIRDQLTSQQKLGDARPIPEVRKALKGGDLQANSKFIVRARINAGDFPPFVDGVTAFVVTDANGHDGDESHNPHKCPFCKRDINNMIAQVQVTDATGQMLQSDVRDLLNVKEFDLLEIEGTGRFDDADMLVINATRIYVKR
ncbi:MAG: hypothetical protein ACK58L_16455 [Planctomycetota bacterium]